MVGSSKKKEPRSYQERYYRCRSGGRDLISTLVRVKDTDLQIFADKEVAEDATDLVLHYRLQIERYIGLKPEFEYALTPMEDDVLAPPIVRDMLFAGKATGIGPMAAVAGSISEYVGKRLLASGYREVIVENGGDLFVKRDRDVTLAIFAGQSPLSMKVGLKVSADRMPTGICTSSGTVGHSLSFGTADSVTVVAQSTPLADAAATRLGNEVGGESKSEKNIRRVLDLSRSIAGLEGVVVICGEKMGAVGDIELVRLN